MTHQPPHMNLTTDGVHNAWLLTIDGKEFDLRRDPPGRLILFLKELHADAWRFRTLLQSTSELHPIDQFLDQPDADIRDELDSIRRRIELDNAHTAAVAGALKVMREVSKL